MSSQLSTQSQPHSQTTHVQHANRARYIVLLKGVFDMFFAFGIMFMPIAAYDGPVPAFVSKSTGLQFIYRDADPGGAYALASLIMGCAVAALSAGMSHQDDAYKVIATLNAVFAYTGLLGCLFSPKKFGSSLLFLASLQDVVWFLLIVGAGGFTLGETFGLKKAVEKVHKKKAQFVEHEKERREHEHHARSEKEHSGEKENENHGHVTGGQYTGATRGTNHGGLPHRQTRSSVSTGGRFGSVGFGTDFKEPSVSDDDFE